MRNEAAFAVFLYEKTCDPVGALCTDGKTTEETGSDACQNTGCVDPESAADYGDQNSSLITKSFIQYGPMGISSSRIVLNPDFS